MAGAHQDDRADQHQRDGDAAGEENRRHRMGDARTDGRTQRYANAQQGAEPPIETPVPCISRRRHQRNGYLDGLAQPDRGEGWNA